MSQLLEEIQIHGVSDAISEQILKLISTGALRPGDALPPQRRLASKLGVSLSSLREALRGLAASNSTGPYCFRRRRRASSLRPGE
jgi:DNA-binding FadR family transcriptional regulator